MSKVLNIRKTLRLQKQLERSFEDTPQVTIRTRHIEDHSVHVTVHFSGSPEFECIKGEPTYTALHPSDRVHPKDLYQQALHPIDHWVDVMVQQDTLAQEGKL